MLITFDELIFTKKIWTENKGNALFRFWKARPCLWQKQICVSRGSKSLYLAEVKPCLSGKEKKRVISVSYLWRKQNRASRGRKKTHYFFQKNCSIAKKDRWNTEKPKKSQKRLWKKVKISKGVPRARHMAVDSPPQVTLGEAPEGALLR